MVCFVGVLMWWPYGLQNLTQACVQKETDLSRGGLMSCKNISSNDRENGVLLWWAHILQNSIEACARKETENVRNHDMTDALCSKFRTESENHTNRARGPCFVRFLEKPEKI